VTANGFAFTSACFKIQNISKFVVDYFRSETLEQQLRVTIIRRECKVR
jgi:hypothetical protein